MVAEAYGLPGWEDMAEGRADMVSGSWLVIRHPYSASREQTENGSQGLSVTLFLQ